MAKIAFFSLMPWEKKRLGELLKGHNLKFYNGEFNAHTATRAKGCHVLGVFAHSHVDRKSLAKTSTVKYVAVMATGFNNVNIPELRKMGIKAGNVPSYGEGTVAEYAFGILLSISRKLPETFERTKRGDFSIKGLEGFGLKSKTLGIIGTGAIGKKIAKIARGFEMEVIAFDLRPDRKYAKKTGFKYASFNSLLRDSDIISLNVPLNPRTFHLISREEFALMKKGVTIINTSRGAVIDTKELIKNLKNGKVSHAGLDVLEGEENIADERELLMPMADRASLLLFAEDSFLIRNGKVIITPHNAFNTREALEMILETTAQNIKSFLNGKTTNRIV